VYVYVAHVYWSIFSLKINQLIVSTIQDLMEIKLDGRDNILPDIVQIMDTFKDAG